MKRSFARELRFAATQLAVWAGLYGAYLALRSLAIRNAGEASAYAVQPIRLERGTRLFAEARVQHAVASGEALRVFFDLYYMLGFGPLLGLSLVWLGLRRRGAYRELLAPFAAAASIARGRPPRRPARAVRTAS